VHLVKADNHIDFYEWFILWCLPLQKTYKKNPADFAMSFPTDKTKLGKHEEGLNVF
jgi:hypothetical protein